MIFARRFGFCLLLCRAKIFGHRSKTTHRVVLFTAFESLFVFSAKQKRNADWRPVLLWRRERDSNPRVLAHKLISSQPRYDHFDISPYMIKPKMDSIFVVYLAGRPVMSCFGARNFLLAKLAKFRPLPLLMPRFITHRVRSATSPLRYLSVIMMRSP